MSDLKDTLREAMLSGLDALDREVSTLVYNAFREGWFAAIEIRRHKEAVTENDFSEAHNESEMWKMRKD